MSQAFHFYFQMCVYFTVVACEIWYYLKFFVRTELSWVGEVNICNGLKKRVFFCTEMEAMNFEGEFLFDMKIFNNLDIK